mgnify:FL=1
MELILKTAPIALLLALLPCCTAESDDGAEAAGAADASQSEPDSDASQSEPDGFVNEAGNEEICSRDKPNATVTGTTPSGELDQTYAWFYMDRKCNTARIAFDNEPRVEISPQGRFVNDSILRIDVLRPWELGDRPATFFAGDPDSTEPTPLEQGFVHVTESSDQTLTGSFHLDTEGWHIYGTFDIDSECYLPVSICI